MRRKKTAIVIYVLLFVCTPYLFAQRSDSLKAALNGMKDDTVKINTWLAICHQNGDIADLEKNRYALNALALSEKLNYSKGIIASHIAVGIICNNSGKYNEALDHLNTALDLASGSGDKIVLARIYNCIGASWYSKADYPAAASWYMKALALYEGMNRGKDAADVIYNISVIYAVTKKYDKAWEYTSRAASIYKSLKDTLHFAMAETQLGNIAYEQYQYDTALVYFKYGLKYTENLKDQTYVQISLNGIGSVLSETGRYEEALIYHTKALETANKMDDKFSEANSIMNTGRAYSLLKRFSEAEKYLKQAVTLSRQIGARRITCDSYGLLWENYEKKGDYRTALEYSGLFRDLSDSLYNEENAEVINSLTAKYESEKKEKAIALLNAELLDKDAKVKEKNLIILSIAGGTLLLFVSVFLFFSRQRLRQKNRFQAELNDQQKKSANAVIQMQEDERNRIARELHDGVGTFLSTLKLNLQASENTSDLKPGSYKNNSELLDRTSEELRKITRGLSNELLQERGLSHALRELVQSIQSTGAVNIQFLTDEADQRYDAILESNYYRIAQELINNSIKHARASKISLQLIDHDTEVLLMLEDNGSGFDVAKAFNGMGLKNISNRARFLGGTFKMESVPEQGSIFIIEVPKKVA